MKLHTLYFSPTGTTKKIVRHLAKKLSQELNLNNCEHWDFTLPVNRQNTPLYEKGDLVIVGTPVYAGRVPNILLDFLNSIEGNGALAIGIVLYGNRNYDDALVELREILVKNGLNCIGAGAFIGEHSFSKILAKDRPDSDDMLKAQFFANEIFKKLQLANDDQALFVPGQVPFRPYYRPINPQGEFVDIRKVKPKTKDTCTDCKICSQVCPTGSIPFEDVTTFTGICIKCGACIKRCPVNAKYYDDINYLRHQYELEDEFSERRMPEIFI